MDINFDEASLAWRKNKRRNKGGSFSYKCCYIHTDGTRCNRSITYQHPYLGAINTIGYFCRRHLRRQFMPHIHKWD